MLGTFLVLLVRPDIAFQDGNPLLLSTGLAVGTQVRRPRPWRVTQPDYIVRTSFQAVDPADPDGAGGSIPSRNDANCLVRVSCGLCVEEKGMLSQP